MDVFSLRSRLTEDYSSYVQSFIRIRDSRIRDYVDQSSKPGFCGRSR